MVYEDAANCYYACLKMKFLFEVGKIYVVLNAVDVISQGLVYLAVRRTRLARQGKATYICVSSQLHLVCLNAE